MNPKVGDRIWLAQYRPAVPADLEIGTETALSLFQRAAAANSQVVAIHYFDTTLSYADLDRASDRLAADLVARGFAFGDRLAVYLQNQPEFVIAQLATWKAGGVMLPLNPMLKEQELRYQLEDSGATVLVADAELHARVASKAILGTAVNRVLTVPAQGREPVPADGVQYLGQILAADSAAPPSRPVGPHDLAYLVYTSGTTGRPKGAMNSHGNVAFSAGVFRSWMDLDSSDVVLGGAPLFHITGLIAGIAASHAAGCPLVLFHRFEAGACLEAIERRRATFTVMAITAFLAMLDHPDSRTRDLSSLTKVFSGGAPVAPATVERWERLTGSYIHNIYGLTETTSPSHCTPLGGRAPADPRFGTLAVGVPVPNTNSRVADPETGEEVPVGQEGEILIKGPQVVSGYWNQPEATQAAFVDGYLRTGDVGKMDELGYFHVVDRIKDMINASGYKVWPREVEDFLYQHPAIREAAVVGVPDDYRGESVKAFVSLRQGQRATAEEIIDFCRQRMAAYKYPREVVVLDELPKTATGKFLRRELRRGLL